MGRELDSNTEPASAARLAGRYELLGLVAVGGMGSVYRARDFELDEIVALKMLRRELIGSDEMLARFRQEVKLARRVTHRNVARTYDIGEHAGEKFLTMEYVEGESLGAVLARAGALPIAECVFIATEICAGLSAAHASGVIHRDLKPDNVLLTKDRRVVITDFGIARSVDPAAGAFATMGVVTGTPAYMAPEQVEGGTIDHRVDIYALGEILFEMLTGVPPWRGESIVQVAAARLHRPPPQPREKRPDVPDALDALVARAMAQKPEARFGSASEIAEALSSLTLPASSALSAPPSAVVIDRTPRTPSQATATKDGDKTLAVLLFRNVGPESDAYLAEGLTEDLIDALSVVRGLRVRALGVVQSFRDPNADARAIGQKLDVQVVVDGSVRKVGDAMRVNARVVSVSDGFQLWAKRFERPVSAFLEVGDEIANAIVEALLVERKAPAREAPTDPAALELYLRARHELKVSFREGTQRAIALFSEALRLAPRDPVILSGYAMAQVRELSFGDNAAAAETVAREIIDEAVQLAPNAPEPHLAVAALKLSVGESEAAAQSLVKALSLGRPGWDAHEMVGAILVESGPLEAAHRHMELALALEPRLHHRRGELARISGLLGDDARARELFDLAPDEAAVAPGFWVAMTRWLLWRRDVEAVRALLAVGGARAVRYPVRGILEVVASGNVTPEAIMALDMRIGRGSRALRRTAYFSLIKAEVLAFFDDDAGALAAVLDADTAKTFDTIWFERCPLVDRLRPRPEFAAAAARTAERAAVMRKTLGY